MTKTISCVIRTYNEAKWIGKLIDTLRSQSNVSFDREIVVVDSGSTDASVDIVKNLDVKLIEIQKAEFNYSKALNLGIENSTGDLIVILSAHSIPREDGWLQRIIGHFKDEKVAGVYCRQIPWPDADPFEVLRIEKTFGETSRNFSKEASNANISFSNVASCIRRKVWEKHPFIILPAAEDFEWAQWAIENGYKIVYDAQASVYHSHRDTCSQAARRMIELEKAADIRLLRKRTFFLMMKQVLSSLIRGIVMVLLSARFKGNRVRYSARCLLISFWYVVNFKRKGK